MRPANQVAQATLFEEERTFTVGELGEAIRQVVCARFSEDVWVEGEIRNLKRPSSGHVYFDLVDPPARPGQAPEALIPVTLFRATKEIVNQVIRRAGDAMKMSDGVRVRIRAVPDFYPPRGQLQLRMTGIDPSYTLGELLSHRDRLIQRLKQEDLLERNRAVAFPALPLRIALVTAQRSAAYADFLQELERSGLSFTVVVLDVPTQGDRAALSIAAAIIQAERLAVDVIATVRGGGARTDLLAFDDERVARAIAARSIPVLTGVGHEIDSSVADAVACRSFKTPTACAAHLVDIVTAAETAVLSAQARVLHLGTARLQRRHADVASLARQIRGAPRAALARAGTAVGSHQRAIARATRQRIDADQARLDRATRRLAGTAGAALAGRSGRLAAATELLGRRGRRVLLTSDRQVDQLEHRRRLLDPVLVLARGWSITRGRSGAVVRRVAELRPGDTLHTRLVDGTITSIVQDISPVRPQEAPR